MPTLFHWNVAVTGVHMLYLTTEEIIPAYVRACVCRRVEYGCGVYVCVHVCVSVRVYVSACGV